MKKAILLLCSLVLITFTGCGKTVKENDPENLAQIPYTFVGEDGDWSAKVEVRSITDEDLKNLQQGDEDKVDQSTLKDGYRSAFYITYKGETAITELTYTFGEKTQWACKGQLKPDSDSAAIKDALSGEDDLGGLAFSKDAKVGGPVPPKSTEFTLKIEAKGQDGSTIKVEFPVKAS